MEVGYRISHDRDKNLFAGLPSRRGRRSRNLWFLRGKGGIFGWGVEGESVSNERYKLYPSTWLFPGSAKSLLGILAYIVMRAIMQRPRH